MTITETSQDDLTALLDQLTDKQCQFIWRVVRSEIESNQLEARLAHITLPEGWGTDEHWAEYLDTERREIYGPQLGPVQPILRQRGDGGFEDEIVSIQVPKEVGARGCWDLTRSEALDLARKLVAAADEIGRVVG